MNSLAKSLSEIRVTGKKQSRCTLAKFSIASTFPKLHNIKFHKSTNFSSLLQDKSKFSRHARYLSIHATSDNVSTTETAPVKPVVERIEDTQEGIKQSREGVPVLEVIQVGEYQVEIIKVRAKNSNAQAPPSQLLVLPGNPGIPEYYSEFCAKLWDLTNGEKDVVCLGLAGHTGGPRLLPKGVYLSMQQQMEHIDCYVSDLLARGCPGLTVAGHSIGAYFALDVLKRHPTEVASCVGIYPYITNNPQSDEQRVINKLVHLRPVVFLVAVVAGIIGRLSRKLSTALLLPITQGKGKEMDPEAADLTRRSMARYEMFTTMCEMGRTELDALESPPDWDFIAANQDRVKFIFCKDDFWAPMWLKEEMNKRLPNMVTVVDPKYSHTFSVTKEGSRDIANMISELIDC